MVLSDRVEDHLGSGGLSGSQRSLLPIALFVSFSSTHSQCAQRGFTLTVTGLTSSVAQFARKKKKAFLGGLAFQRSSFVNLCLRIWSKRGVLCFVHDYFRS